MTATTTWVRSFDGLDELKQEIHGGWDAVRGLLGGKGANLAEMTRLGIPVPPGFTITTQACLHYLQGGNVLPTVCGSRSCRVAQGRGGHGEGVR